VDAAQIPTGPDEYRATLVIQGPNLDLEGISNTLGVAPTHVHRRGELSKTKRPFPDDMWSCSSPLARNDSLDEHLKWLEHTFSAHYEFLRTLCINAQVYVYCGYTTEAEQSSFTLSAEALSLITELGISMDFHVLALSSGPDPI
jgi:hypothetical protein